MLYFYERAEFSSISRECTKMQLSISNNFVQSQHVSLLRFYILNKNIFENKKSPKSKEVIKKYISVPLRKYCSNCDIMLL